MQHFKMSFVIEFDPILILKQSKLRSKLCLQQYTEIIILMIYMMKLSFQNSCVNSHLRFMFFSKSYVILHFCSDKNALMRAFIYSFRN